MLKWYAQFVLCVLLLLFSMGGCTAGVTLLNKSTLDMFLGAIIVALTLPGVFLVIKATTLVVGAFLNAGVVLTPWQGLTFSLDEAIEYTKGKERNR